MAQPPIRPDTWRNPEGLVLSLGIRLCRSLLIVLKSSPACSAVGATLPRRRFGWSYPSGEPHLPFQVKPLSPVLMDDLKVAHKYGGDDGA